MCGYEIKKIYPHASCGMEYVYRCEENRTKLLSRCETKEAYCGMNPDDFCLLYPNNPTECVNHKRLRTCWNFGTKRADYNK